MSGSQTPNTAEREEPRTDGRVLLQAGSEAGGSFTNAIAKRFVKEPRCPEPRRENTRKGFKGRSGLRDFFFPTYLPLAKTFGAKSLSSSCQRGRLGGRKSPDSELSWV